MLRVIKDHLQAAASFVLSAKKLFSPSEILSSTNRTSFALAQAGKCWCHMVVQMLGVVDCFKGFCFNLMPPSTIMLIREASLQALTTLTSLIIVLTLAGPWGSLEVVCSKTRNKHKTGKKRHCPLKINSSTCCNHWARWCFDVQDVCASTVSSGGTLAVSPAGSRRPVAPGARWRTARPSADPHPTAKLLLPVTWPTQNRVPHGKAVWGDMSRWG